MPPPTRSGLTSGGRRAVLRGPAALLLACLALAGCAERADLVLAGGRVVDPESGLDGTRWIAITGGRVVAVSERSLGGREVLNVTGLVVGPGFIDMRASVFDSASLAALALDGVATALLLEPGVHPVGSWLAAHAEGPLNVGAAVAHARARGEAFPLRVGEGVVPPDQPLDGTAMEALVRRVRQGLAEGALGIGFTHAAVPGATTLEVEDLFAVAGFERVPVFARPRDASSTALAELLAAAAPLGTPLHLVGPEGWAADSLEAVLARVDSAARAGVDVSIELTAGIAAADEEPGSIDRGTILAGDRGTGVFVRALAPHMRAEPGAQPGALAHAFARVSTLPARRLERVAPDFRRKGRIQVGADADLVVLDPVVGAVRHLVVGGVVVVREGRLVGGARPGRVLRGGGEP